MKKLSIYLLTFGLTFGAFAQLDFDLLLEAGAKDTEKYLENYMAPAFLGFGYAMNGSWYNTAKPHKLLGFDLTVSATVAYIPTLDNSWKFKNQDFDNLSLVSGTEAKVPTIYGPNTDADDLPELRFTDPESGDEILRMSAITGMGLKDSGIPVVSSNAQPAAMLQLGLGLIKNTEIKFRILPEQSLDGGNVKTSLIGFGIMHDFKQWIPGLSALPIDLSAFYGFTRLNTTYFLDRDLKQSFNFDVNSNTFQVIASKKLAVFTPYVSVGFSNANADLFLKGDYELESGEILSNPVNFQNSGSTMRTSIGGRLKLLVLTIHAEYVIAKYNLFSAGIGISVR